MSDYNEDSIRSLQWNVHLRERPGMYIGKLGDGSEPDDGIYVLLKEVIDNSIDEFMRGYGRNIEVTIKDSQVSVRDYGRGMPLGKVIDCVARINTGGKFDDQAYDTAIGMNGVGVKAVNALSTMFFVSSVVNGKKKSARFSAGEIVEDFPICETDEHNGTFISFLPDDKLFENFHWYGEHVERLLWNYAYLNRGLTINFNGKKFVSKNGLLDLLHNNVSGEMLYEPIHLKDNDFEFALVHTPRRYGEDYFSFVNSQYTLYGGTHQQAYKEAIVKAFREFFKKEYDPVDIRTSIFAALSLRVKNAMFEQQTKTKLGSIYMEPGGQTIRNYVNDNVCRLLDNYLHIHPEVADAIQKKIQESERERKAIANLKKATKETQKKVSLNNSKLRDCRYHYNTNDKLGSETMIFLTEGNSASGSITQSRDANTQAVFSLRGKPENVFKCSKQTMYRNEELNLLRAAIRLDDGVDGIRYNKIVLATDADVDGMHIRLLLLTFFLHCYPDIVNSGHVYILQTPLFRVRNKQKTIYCYSEAEKQSAIQELKGKPEITRFKGLGEISANEFVNFIGKSIRLDKVILDRQTDINDLLSFYMGDNDVDRQNFVFENLRDEIDVDES